MSISATLSTLGNYSIGAIKFVTTAALANTKITALVIGILSASSFLPTASAGPAVEIVCMGLCTVAAMVHPTAAIFWPQCMKFCEITGYAPTP